MRLGLSEPTRRRNAHSAARRAVFEEEGVVLEVLVELAVGAAGAADGQTGVVEVAMVATARRMVETSRWARSAREQWSRMEGTTLGCGGKPCLRS